MNIRAYGIKELAAKYGIDPRTLKAWIKAAGIQLPKHTKLLTPAQVQIVIQQYGPVD